VYDISKLFDIGIRVSVASRPRLERWWAGGSLTDPIA
jgi:hypothetical protein